MYYNQTKQSSSREVAEEAVAEEDRRMMLDLELVPKKCKLVLMDRPLAEMDPTIVSSFHVQHQQMEGMMLDLDLVPKKCKLVLMDRPLVEMVSTSVSSFHVQQH